MTQSVRLIGRHFQGVVASRGLLPDASQDVAKVFSERARIVVADGAGDTGGAAGEWAGVLALCYGTSQEMERTPEPEWIGRAVHAWNHTSNLSNPVGRGSSVNQQELALLQRGVDASFIGAAFDDRVGTLSVHLVAAGDCEAFLFRNGALRDWAPIRTRENFSSTPRSLNSRIPHVENLIYAQWQLQDGDVLIFCSDALAQFILTACGDEGRVPSEVQSLILCTEWQDLRQHVATWLEERRLRNDDVAIVRVSIHQGPGTARFSLVQDRRSYAREATAAPVLPDEMTLGVLEEAAQHNTNDVASLHETRSQALDEEKVSRKILYSLLGAFVLGTLVGAVLPFERMLRQKAVAEMAEERLGGSREAGSGSAIPTPMQSPSTTPSIDLPDRQTTPDVVNAQPTVKVNSTVSRQQPARTLTSGEEERRRNETRAAGSNPTGEGKITIASATPTRSGEPSQQEESPLPERASVNASATPSTGPSPALTPAQPEVPSEVESSPAPGAVDSSTVAAPQEQTDHKTSEAGIQPKTLGPCILPKDTRLYSTANGKASILVIKAPRAMCILEDITSDQQRVTISAWLKIRSTGPKWLSGDRIKETIDVRTAPFGDDGSEYLGKVRRGTPFTVGRREKRMGENWVELKITAYRHTK